MKPEEIAHYYEVGTLGSFSTGLMNLFCKADTLNKVRLGIAFPEYEESYSLWFYKPEGWNDIEKKEVKDD